MGGGDDWVFVLVRRTAEDRDKRGPKLAPILVVDVLGAAPRPPKLLRTSVATEFEVGLVQNIRGSPRLRAARFIVAIPERFPHATCSPSGITLAREDVEDRAGPKGSVQSAQFPFTLPAILCECPRPLRDLRTCLRRQFSRVP
jgi:hypothetical protein